jgi:hypothetical protein
MQIVISDEVIPLRGTTPNYTVQNPIWKVAAAVENNRLGAELEQYDLPSLQYCHRRKKIIELIINSYIL